MNKLENLQICVKDGEVVTLQGLNTVSAERLEDILNYVMEVKVSMETHKLNNRAVGLKRVAHNCKRFIRCCKYALKD